MNPEQESYVLITNVTVAYTRCISMFTDQKIILDKLSPTRFDDKFARRIVRLGSRTR